MRIGIVYLGRRGAGGVISFQLATHLKKQVGVFAVVSSFAENLSVWRNGSIPLIEVPTFTSPRQVIEATLNLPRQWRMLRLIEREKLDVLFFPMLHWWAPVIQWGLRRIPNVVTIHDPEPHPGILGRAEWQFQRICLQLATRCVVPSKCFVLTLEHLGIPREKIDVIPLGELSSYYSRQSDHARVFDLSQPTLLFFGRITAYKGLDVLFRAFSRIEKESNARLLVVGAGDLKPYQDQLGKLSRLQIVNEWVPDDQVEYYFRQAQIVVAPYTSATQSGVVAIASGMGIPVIAARTGGMSEQIEHGKTGILVEPGSVDDLAQACLRLLNDRAFADTLARQARAAAQNEFGWDTIAEQVLASCQRAIASHRRAG
jgi:glycosyltransferase involved in cell wall biosynthesis